MRVFYYTCFLLLILSCQGASQYDGHWHMVSVPLGLENIETLVEERLRNEVEYIVLELENGEGFWDKNRNQHDSWRTVNLENSNKELWVTGAACGFGLYKIELRNSTLYLNNEDGKTRYIGYKCEELYCNKQQDYFSDENVKIDLPIITDTSQSIRRPIKQSLHRTFYLGEPKSILGDTGYGSPSQRLSDGYKFLTIRDLPIVLEKSKIKVPEKFRDQMTYSISADKDTKTNRIIELGAALQELEINECYIAVREDSDLHKDFAPRYIKYTLDDLALIPNNISIGEHMSGQY